MERAEFNFWACREERGKERDSLKVKGGLHFLHPFSLLFPHGFIFARSPKYQAPRTCKKKNKAVGKSCTEVSLHAHQEASGENHFAALEEEDLVYIVFLPSAGSSIASYGERRTLKEFLFSPFPLSCLSPPPHNRRLEKGEKRRDRHNLPLYPLPPLSNKSIRSIV